MAISSQTTTVSYTGNASLVTPYPVTFRYDEAAWVVVQEIDEDGAVTTLSLGSDYTLTGNGSTTTGNVVTGGGAIPATSTLRITRDTALTQAVSLAVNGTIPSAVLEAEFDKLTMAHLDEKRRQAAGLARSLRVPDGETLAELPAAASRKGEVVYFNATTGEAETKTPDEILALTESEIAADIAAAEAAATAADASADAAAASAAEAEALLEGGDAINSQPYCLAKVSDWTTSAAAPVWLGITGDSLAFLGPLRRGPLMADAGSIGYGIGSSSGSVTATTTDFASWITGITNVFASGSSAQFSCGDASPTHRRGNKLVVYYLKKSGGGTFDIQYESASAIGTWTAATGGTAISASNASTIGAVFEADLPTTNTPSYKIRINNVTGGGVTIIGAGIYHSTGGGVVTIKDLLGKSGLDLASFVGVTPSAVYTPIYTHFAPDLMLSCWADGTDGASAPWDSGGLFRTWYAATSAIKSATDWVIVSANPASTETYHATVRASQRTWALETGHSYVDGWSMFRSYTFANAAGLMADTIHLSTKGGVFRNNVLWSKLPVGSFPLGSMTQFVGGGDYTPFNSRGIGDFGENTWEVTPSLTVTGSAAEIFLCDQTTPLNLANRSSFANVGGLMYGRLAGTNVWVMPTGPTGFFGISPTGTGYKLGGYGGFNWDVNGRNMVTTGTDVYTPDTLSGAGAIPITTPVTLFTSTGAAQALTLANGTAGQKKTIVHDVDGGSGVLTPTTKTGFTTVTFTASGDTVTLQYFTTRGWMVIGSFGAVIA